MKILLVKKRTIISILVCIFLLTCFFLTYFFVKPASLSKPKYSIVIDAGHGGIDGGASGKQTGVTESYLNLVYAKTLGKICEEFGFRVIQTRNDMEGLYDENAPSKKKSEMQKRESVIDNSNADLVVSLHMNSFSTSNIRGAHVFYDGGNEAGKVLAECIAESLAQNVEHAHGAAKMGDYYVLNCTKKPAVLVECGFLSNPDEEKLLQEEDYIDKFCYYVFCGILKFFSF